MPKKKSIRQLGVCCCISLLKAHKIPFSNHLKLDFHEGLTVYQVTLVFYFQVSIVRHYLKEGDTKIHMLEYYTVICTLYVSFVKKAHRESQGIFPPSGTKDAVFLFSPSPYGNFMNYPYT